MTSQDFLGLKTHLDLSTLRVYSVQTTTQSIVNSYSLKNVEYMNFGLGIREALKIC